jgi:hypothetical protein
MAGTLTISTLSDGTNSTSATNPIRGSAKAWVQFTDIAGVVVVIQSFNCSSIVRNATGYFTFNFTTALPNAGYAPSGSAGGTLATNSGAVSVFQTPSTGVVVAPTTSAFVFTSYSTGGAPFDPTYVCITVHSS